MSEQSRYSNTMYNRFLRVRSAVADKSYWVNHGHMPHQELCEMHGKINGSNDYRRLNSYYTGYIDAMIQSIWFNAADRRLTFGYVRPSDNMFIPSHILGGDDLRNCHAWKNGSAYADSCKALDPSDPRYDRNRYYDPDLGNRDVTPFDEVKVFFGFTTSPDEDSANYAARKAQEEIDNPPVIKGVKIKTIDPNKLQFKHLAIGDRFMFRNGYAPYDHFVKLSTRKYRYAEIDKYQITIGTVTCNVTRLTDEETSAA